MSPLGLSKEIKKRERVPGCSFGRACSPSHRAEALCEGWLRRRSPRKSTARHGAVLPIVVARDSLQRFFLMYESNYHLTFIEARGLGLAKIWLAKFRSAVYLDRQYLMIKDEIALPSRSCLLSGRSFWLASGSQ